MYEITRLITKLLISVTTTTHTPHFFFIYLFNTWFCVIVQRPGLNVFGHYMEPNQWHFIPAPQGGESQNFSVEIRIVVSYEQKSRFGPLATSTAVAGS